MTQIRFDGCDLSPRGARTPRFGKRIAALAAVLALAGSLVLAGCGGGGDGGGRLSKADYTRKLNDAGLQLSAVFGTIDQGASSPTKLEARVKRARKTLDRVRTSIERLEPPKDAAPSQQKLVNAMKLLSLDLRNLVMAADSGSEKAVKQARSELSLPGRQIVGAIQQLQQLGYDVNRGP